MKTIQRAFWLASASMAAVSLCAGPAFAQDAMSDIVVTARRVTERLQDTPLSVTVVTANTLQNAQITSTDDLDQITPSLQFAPIAPLSGNNSAAQVFIRGIGQTDPTAGVDPGVGIYIDGVYMGSAVGGVMDFRDIANVQVLRGPQGTLFGRNTVGGAILLTSQAPGDELGGYVRVGAGTDSLYEGFLAVDVPLSDEFRTRWTIGRRKRDGYVTRPFDGLDLGDENSLTATTSMALDPSDRWHFELHADYTWADENGAPLTFAAIDNGPPYNYGLAAPYSSFPRAIAFSTGCTPSVGTVVPENNDPRCPNNQWNDGPYIANGTGPVTSQLEAWGVSFTGELKMSEAWSLKSISAYRHLAWAGQRDADNTPFPILHTDYDSDGEQMSQELQLVYSSDPLTIVAGLYYFKQETSDILEVTLFPPPRAAAPPAPLSPEIDHNDNIITNTSKAAFVQATWDITDQLSVTGGVRYTEETKQSLPNQFRLFPTPRILFVRHETFERDFEATTGSASIQYRWNDAIMTYASWSQGFKGGGFNSRFNAPVPPDPASGNPGLEPPAFDQETAESYELGAKLDPTDDLVINLAVFHTSYDDIQLTYRFGAAPYIFNAGEATIQGAEGELHYRPTDDWAFDANVSYLDDQFESIRSITFGGVTSPTPVRLASQLPYVPEWQGSAAAEYSAHFGSLVFTTRGEIVYTSSQFFDTGNTKEISQIEDITTFNLGFTLEPADGPWQARLGWRNVTDEQYPIAGNSSLTSSSGYAEVAYNRGSEAVLSLSTRF